VVALVAASGFVVLHLILMRAIPLIIDIDELQYGEFGVLILKGLFAQLAVVKGESRFVVGHEGFHVIFGPLVTPFFAVFGASLETLRMAYVTFAGAWAAVWATVGRRLAPQAPVWAVVGLFVLPTPFISRYAVSPIGMSVHLGVSAAYGLTLVMLLAARRATGVRQKWALLFATGLVAGLGSYGGLIMGAFLPGIVFGVVATAGLGSLVPFLLGILPGLTLAIPVEDFSGFLGTGDPRVAIGLEGYLQYRLDLWRPVDALLHAPGYAAPESWQWNYLRAGLFYFPFVTVVYLVGSWVRPKRREPLIGAMLISAVCLLGMFVKVEHTFGGSNPLQWCAIRYTAPLLPMATVVVLISCSRLASVGRSGATAIAGVLLMFHAIGFGSHISLKRVFDDPISTAWIRPHTTGLSPLSFPIDELPDSSLADVLGLRLGMTAYALEQADVERIEQRARAHGLQGRALEEYWRGVGRSHVQLRRSEMWNPRLLAELPAEWQAFFWQGVGMEFHAEDYHQATPEGLERVVPSTAAQLDAFAWGWGRACTRDDHVPNLLPDLVVDRRLGRRVRWELDLAVADAPPVTDEDLQTLAFVRWCP
jgi:hypothetical protein